MKKIVLVFFLLVSTLPAQEVKLWGRAIPGGLIIGNAPSAVNVKLNGKNLQIDNNGFFIFGFDRDDKGIFTLNVKFNNGKNFSKKFKLLKRKYYVQKINHLKEKFVKPPHKYLKKIERERKIKSNKRKLIGEINKAFYSVGFVRPVKGGRISSKFGSQRILNGVPKSPHNGLDIALPTGTKVRAMTDGRVILTANNFYYSGNFVLIDHGQGLTSTYLHLRKILVKEGDFVRKGEIIGEVGSTGRATGPHLHWGVMWYKKRIDPNEVLKIKINRKPRIYSATIKADNRQSK